MRNSKIITKTTNLALAVLALFFIFLPVHAQTGHVIGGSNLISQAQANQFAVWLNEGHVALTKIFSKTAGDGKDAEDFHAAADAQGRTVTFFRVAGDIHSGPYLVGGYNPQSWASFEDYHLTLKDSDRRAFIFNLTSNFIQRQKLRWFMCPGDNDPGLKQTYNFESFGPAFGQGDLWVEFHLESGVVSNFSYGTTCQNNHILNVDYPLQESVDYLAFEVFKIALIPTAAQVSVSGRVLTSSGNGISNMSVILTDGNGISRTALTSSLGYYQFDEVQAGRSYVVSISSKRYSFNPPSQLLNVREQLEDVNFITDSQR
ncbi:MAG TPA: PEP_CTERM-anchored TLD domain-containing protein [Pyrinomonadaceae bacterium]|jgi:hypothetical protein|nr:PEP_CTERM-anchored TLD domain-containing protein [Pyrinomonadaceae bacterium]